MEANSKSKKINQEQTTNLEEQNPYMLVLQANSLITDAVGQVMNKFGLPSYIIDGILSDILSEIRKKELYDVGYISMKKNERDTEAENGEHNTTT